MLSLNKQVAGNHYSSMAIQPAEFIIENRLGFCEGNVVKYVTRYQAKNGVEDLRKARHIFTTRIIWGIKVMRTGGGYSSSMKCRTVNMT